MTRIKKILILCLTLIFCLFSSGCWDQLSYEQIGFILSLSVEPSEDGKLLVSYTSPVTDPNKREQVEFLASSVGNLREFRENARKISAKLLQGGKIQQVIISSDIANKGINNILELFERDSQLPPIAYVIISETSPKLMLGAAQNFGDKPRPGFYIRALIENNSKSSYCPDTTVWDFTTDSFAPGIDPIVPLIKLQSFEGKGIKVTGSALFSGDKMVGKINPRETALLLAMKNKFKSTEYIFTSLGPVENDKSGKSGAAAEITNLKRNIDIKIEDDIPVVNINLNFIAILDEHSWDRMDKEEEQKKLEDLMSKEVTDTCKKLLQYTQEVGSDPIGIGDIIRAKHNSYWKSVKWEEAYKDVKFKVNAKVALDRYGIIK